MIVCGRRECVESVSRVCIRTVYPYCVQYNTECLWHDISAVMQPSCRHTVSNSQYALEVRTNVTIRKVKKKRISSLLP